MYAADLIELRRSPQEYWRKVQLGQQHALRYKLTTVQKERMKLVEEAIRLQQLTFKETLQRQRLEETMRIAGRELDGWLRDAEQKKQLQERLYRELLQDSPESLSGKLGAEDVLLRFVAVQAAGKRRLPQERELIGLLADASPEVRQAARQALVRLARGTDFGPPPKATPAQVVEAQTAWHGWLALQDRRPDSPRAAAAGPPGPVAPGAAAPGQER